MGAGHRPAGVLRAPPAAAAARLARAGRVAGHVPVGCPDPDRQRDPLLQGGQ